MTYFPQKTNKQMNKKPCTHVMSLHTQGETLKFFACNFRTSYIGSLTSRRASHRDMTILLSKIATLRGHLCAVYYYFTHLARQTLQKRPCNDFTKQWKCWLMISNVRVFFWSAFPFVYYNNLDFNYQS